MSALNAAGPDDAPAPRDLVVVSINLADSWLDSGGDSVLSRDERERAARLRLPDVRRRFAAGRVALRRILAAALADIHGPGIIADDRDAADFAFEYSEHGKPALPAHDGLHFNASHSGDHGLVALSRGGPVGVDLEILRSISDPMALAARFFAVRETAFLSAAPEPDRSRLFQTLWTRKEAVLKLLGAGLTVPLRAFAVSGDDPPRVVSVDSAFGRYCSDDFLLRAVPSPEGTVAVVATGWDLSGTALRTVAATPAAVPRLWP